MDKGWRRKSWTPPLTSCAAFSPEPEFPLLGEGEGGQSAGSSGGLNTVAHVLAGRQHAWVAAAVTAGRTQGPKGGFEPHVHGGPSRPRRRHCRSRERPPASLGVGRAWYHPSI